METFKKVLHVVVPPANIVVASLITTLNFTLENDESNKYIISSVAFLQVFLTIMNQVYSKLMKGEELKLKNEVIEKESIIKELSTIASLSNRSSVTISSLTTSEAQSHVANEPVQNEPVQNEPVRNIYEYII